MMDTNAQARPHDLDAYRHLIERLPVTLRPSLNQQLSQWELLFPFELNRLAAFMKGVQAFSPDALDALTGPLNALEMKMGVKQWNFSEASDTIENASLLARSAYYAEWRREVQRVFEAINAAAIDSSPAHIESTRLILLVLPRSLPVDPQTIWRKWDPRGHEIGISGDSERLSELVTQGQLRPTGPAAMQAQPGNAEASDLWLIEADGKLDGTLSSLSPFAVTCLNYETLKPFRDRFLAELNKAPKSIQVTDEIISNLRRESWDGWSLWPPEISGQPRLRKFVIDLYLSGNGALIFSNAFVEWAACEAIRRARPRTMVARFGMRSKPKPFTSIAIFENQQRVSSLPDVDDPENSAVDAAILAHYTWLAACRYPEGEQAICLCVSEFLNSAYLVAPAGKNPGWSPGRAVTPEEVYAWIAAQMAV